MSDVLSMLPGPMQTVVYFFLALFPLVLVHEFGHFAVAKLNKIRVDEFGIGFPPRLVKLFSHGGTDYTINSLPLGGFVRMAGEDDPTIPGAFASRSKSARAAVLFAGPFANFLLAAVILSAGALAFGVERVIPSGGGMVQVMELVAGQPAVAAGVQAGDLIYAVNDKLLVDWASQDATTIPGETPAMAALMAQADASADKPMRLTVLRGLSFVPDAQVSAAPSPGLELAPIELALLRAQRVVSAPAGGTLRAGDVVVEPLGDAGEPRVVLRPTVAGSETAAVAGAVNPVHTLTVTPVRSAPDQPGRLGIQIGALPLVTTRYLGMAEALGYGPQEAVAMIGATVKGLADMIRGAIAPAIAGPVGIARISRQIGEQGFDRFLVFMAILSINLGIINLLPIPALDGGRLMFIAVEAMRGRRIEPTREAVVHVIGFVFVLGLMAVITVWEVAKLSNLSLP